VFTRFFGFLRCEKPGADYPQPREKSGRIHQNSPFFLSGHRGAKAGRGIPRDTVKSRCANAFLTATALS
jgi:hypothetical protein